MSSALPPRGWPGQFIPPVRANQHVAIGRHGPVGSQFRDSLGDDFSDEARAVVLISVHGLGAIVRPFQFFRPFLHDLTISQGSAL